MNVFGLIRGNIVVLVWLLITGLATAQTPLGLNESPAASGYYTNMVADSLTALGVANAKSWSIELEGGDRVSILVSTDKSGTHPKVRLLNAGGAVQASFNGGANGEAQIQNHLITIPGSYTVQVYTDHLVSPFLMRVDMGRGYVLESEPNNDEFTASVPTLVPAVGGFTTKAAGVLYQGADFYDLGTLNPGNAVNIAFGRPALSSLAVGDWEMTLFKQGQMGSPASLTNTATLNASITDPGQYVLRVRANPALSGHALRFDGTNDEVALGNPAALAITGDQTIEMWIKPDNFNARMNPWNKAYGGEGTMTIETDGTLSYFYGTHGGDGGSYQTFATGKTLNAGEWNHIALVRRLNTTPRKLFWYLNGRLVNEADASYFPAASAGRPAILGNGYAGRFRGEMDEVRVWNIARSAVQITTGMAQVMTGNEIGLVAYYPFSEGAGATVADGTANALNGTIAGEAVWTGTAGVGHFSYARQGFASSYIANVTVTDATLPSVAAVRPLASYGHTFDGVSSLILNPGNMTSYRGQNGTSFNVQVTGSGGTLKGSGVYTDDSHVGAAARHAGLLAEGETGLVTVTILPGQASYVGTPQNGITSGNSGSFAGSYSVAAYTGTPPPHNGVYSRMRVDFSERMSAATLQNPANVTLKHAGADGLFDTADDFNHTLTASYNELSTVAYYTINDGPLQPGAHRLRVTTGVQDRSGNALASNSDTVFTVVPQAPYVIENRNNASLVTATPLHIGTGFDRSFTYRHDLQVGTNPHRLQLLDLNGDGHKDAIVACYYSHQIRVYLGNADGSFATAGTDYATGNNPRDLTLVDFDKDGRLDVVVVCYGSNQVRLHRNTGSGTLEAAGTIAVGADPLCLVKGDFNGDNNTDLAVVNHNTGANGRSISLLLGNGTGSFAESRLSVVGNNFRPYGIAAGDINEDGRLDLLVGDIDTDKLLVFTGNGNGTFAAPTSHDLEGLNPTTLAVADFDHDGHLDVAVAAETTAQMAILKGNGNGTFQPYTTTPLGSSGEQYFMEAVDVDNDGWLDLVVPRTNGLVVLYNNKATSAPAFTASIRYEIGYALGAVLADVNGDGRPDFVVNEWNSSRIRTLLGNQQNPMAADANLSRLQHSYGRGQLFNGNEHDWYSFTIQQPKRVVIAVENPLIPGSSGLLYRCYNANGTDLGYFYSDASGRGESHQYNLETPGTYYVRVEPNYGYEGEYRFRVSAFDLPTVIESEANNNIAQADALELKLNVGSLTASVAGYVSTPDTLGDYWSLGNLGVGSNITLNLRIPQSSSLSALLAIYQSNGTQVAVSTAGDTQLSFAVTEGNESAYFFRVFDAADTRGFNSEYLVDVSVADNTRPTITAVTLPAEGAAVTYVDPNFSINFSEDMLAPTVMNPLHYELRNAGGDNVFGNADDSLYSVTLRTTYTAGLTANYHIPDGPLQPGNYRFTVATGVTDKFANGLQVPYVRNFQVQSVPGFVLEGRNNGTQATANGISVAPSNSFDGSFSESAQADTGANLWGLKLLDLNGDGHKDAVVARHNTHQISVHLGSATGTFGPGVIYACGNNPWDIELIDINGDGRLDVAVSCYASDVVRFFTNPGDGTLVVGPVVNVGDGPIHMAKADFNGDGKMDLAVVNHLTGTGGRSVSVLLANNEGGFTESKLTVTGQTVQFYALTVGDFNEDGRVDIAAGNIAADSMAVFLNTGAAFGAPSFYPASNKDPRGATAADFDGDGHLDIAVVTDSSDIFTVLKGNGNGSFQPYVSFSSSDSTDMHFIESPDLNGDGLPDILISKYNGVVVAYNKGGSSFDFTAPARYSEVGYSAGIDWSDVNQDGRIDIVASSWTKNRLYVLTGNSTQGLAADGTVTGMRHGALRGSLTNSSDVDWYSFSALENDRLLLVTENVGAPSQTGKRFRIINSQGATIRDAYADSNGYGEWSVPLGNAGTYYVLVNSNWDSTTEYRVRLTLTPPPAFGEIENNNSLTQNNTLPLVLGAGKLTATVVGVNMPDDAAGDYFNLGNLSPGTQVRVTVTAPQMAVDNLPNQNLQLKHRWSFGESAGSTQFMDSVTGQNNAHLRGSSATVGGGQVILPGGSPATAPYIDLPNGIASSRTGSMTVEGWATINGSQNWSRLFDFGTGTAGELFAPGGSATSQNYFCLTAQSGGTMTTNRMSFTRPSAEHWGDYAVPYNAGQSFHYAVVYDSRGIAGGAVRYYRNGRYLGGYNTSHRLTDLADDNNWLGRSQFTSNSNLNGAYSEFRVWDGAYNEAQAIASATGGSESIAATVSSALAAKPYLTLFKSDGQQMAQVVPGANGSLQFTLGAEDASSYVLRIHNNERSTTALYQAVVEIEDVTPPQIVSNTLPAEGTTVTFPPPVFTLGFSEDMQASTVRDIANYELRGAGVNGAFGDADDTLYSLEAANYVSGLSTTLRILNGPLQAGAYRFTASTGLKDLFEKPMTAPHVRHFSIEGVLGYVTEGRDNGIIANADSLSGNSAANTSDGSFVAMAGFASGGTAPISMLLIDLNKDGKQDLIVSNRDSNNVTVRLGNGDATFGEPTTITVGTKPHYMAKLDFDKDGNEDIVVPNHDSNNVTVLRNKGDGTLEVQATLPAGDGPLSAAAGDFNGDGNPDFAVTNHKAGTNGRSLSIYLGDGLGGFTHSYAGQGLTPTWRPYHLAAADFDGNGRTDLAVCNYDSNDVLVFLATASGGFGDPTRYVTDRVNPTGIAIGDFNGDTKADLVVSYQSWDRVNILPGNGNGTFQSHVNWAMDATREQYNIKAVDMNGDGYPDILSPRWGALVARSNRATPSLSFHSNQIWTELNYVIDAAVADFDGDGHRDMIALSHNQNQVRVYRGQGSMYLTADASIAGLRHGYVRGQLDTSADADFFSFSAKGGEKFILAAESATGGASTGYYYALFDHRGTELTAAGGDYNGYAYTQPYTLPYDGRYYVRVTQNWYSSVEYRFRVSIVDSQTQIEAEANNATGSANVVSFAASAGSRTAKIFGHIARNDASGDFLSLGNLAGGTQINVNLNRPSGTTFTTGLLRVLNSSGAVVATSTSGGANVSHTVANGAEGVYYVSITESEANRNLQSLYLLNLSLTDGLPPQITATNLPAEGSSILTLIHSFTLGFNEDMLASSVMSAGSYSMREAGTDAVLGTSDDVIHNVIPGNYTSGLTASYQLPAPLPPGIYRFTVTGLRDTYGNPLPEPFVRHFNVVQPAGFTTASPASTNSATPTVLIQTEDPTGLITGAGRGRRITTTEVHHWAFEGVSGQRLTFDTELLGASANTNLHWRIYRPDGSTLLDRAMGNDDQGTFTTLSLNATGTYRLQVLNSDSWLQEYRFRLSLINPPLHAEVEANGTLATATPVTLTASGAISSAKAAGVVHSPSDLDYYNLGTIQSGKTLFVSAALPATSSFLPVVAIYNSSGTFVGEVNGSPGDASAEVRINTTGVYYMLVRSTGGTGNYMSQYVAEVQVHDTSSVAIPNLRVTEVLTPPETGLRSGSPYTYSFTVTNVGSANVPAISWSDRLVLSKNLIFGDDDDTEVGVFVREGGLTIGQSYTVTGTANLPQGAVGNYHLIARTDVTNRIDEVILENDNTTASENSFPVTLAPYPNLGVQDLNVTGPVNDVFTLTWKLANTGNANAPAGFKERVRVVNVSTGTLVLDDVRTPGAINAAANLNRTASVTTTAAGVYQVSVIADSQNDLYEHDGESNVTAEANTFTTGFNILQYWTIAVSTPAVDRGSVSGGGTLLASTPVTVTAVPNTSALPYQFVRWSENGAFISANATYSFIASTNRNLVAEFALPTYQISSTVTPAGAGSVSGTGFFAHGSTAQLVATPNQGYNFSRWEENSSNIGTNATLILPVAGPRIVRAVFAEANPTHMVTTATNPAGLGTTTGSGTFNNSQTSTISATENVVNGSAEFVFDHWKLNGVFYGNQPQFTKTFSTLDAPTMNYVAHYTERTLKPAVTRVTSNYANPIRAASDVRFTLTFDRPMKTSVLPVLSLTSGNAAVTPTIPAGGTWLSNTQFESANLTLATGNDGAYTLRATAATDANDRVMDAANVFTFDVDVTAPVNPVLALTSFTGNSATVSWTGYAAPSDLNAFRVYLSEANFTSTAALTAVGGLGSSARTYTFSGLQPDKQYYAAVTAVDAAGNANTTVTPLAVFLDSTVPPPVTFTLTSPTSQSARLNWTAYSTTNLIGFQGWRVYSQEAAFTDVTGLTPVAELAANVKQYDLLALDRAKTYHIAVVGYNRLNEFNPAVTTQTWSDPLAGQITSDLTLGAVDSDQVLEVLQPMVVKPGATLTIQPGTTIKFAAGAGLRIEGNLVAEGTALRPINLTSTRDAVGSTPARGDWNGVTLVNNGPTTSVDHLWIRYGKGLQITDGTPDIGSLYAVANQDQGLAVSGNANVSLTGAFLAFNDRGVRSSGNAVVALTGSVIKTNSVLAAELQGAGATLNMQGNWWGSSVPADIAAMVSGSVNITSPLPNEPVLDSAIALSGNAATTGTRDQTLKLSSVNATAYRLSEDSLFPGVLWKDVFASGETNTFSPYPFTANYQLSSGAGVKTVYAQFRSITGQISAAIPVSVTLITEGPVISSFSLTDGQNITRPLNVTGSATAALGISSFEFLANNAVTASSTVGSVNFLWDIRTLNPGPYRVKLVAKDRAGNESTREVNVTVNPQPPPAPVITAPANQAVVATGTTTVSGTAEAGVTVRLTRNGAPQGQVVATSSGIFSFANVPLVEGNNALVATAEDNVGTRASTVVTVNLDSGPPAAVVLEEPPVYDAFRGLILKWAFGPSGERPIKYKVFWHTAAFTSTAQASGQSGFLTTQNYTLTSAADGDLFISVVGYDAAGNASPLSNQIAYTLDRTAPVFSISYDQSMPVGPGQLAIVLQSNEALSANPLLTIRPNGSASPISVPLTKASGTSYTATYNVTNVSARTGVATVVVTGQDLTGNRFTGSPSGPALTFDVTPPSGTLSFDRPLPIKTVSETDPNEPEDVNVSFSLTLSESPKPGTSPSLVFTPPIGADVTPVMAGSGVNWTGNLLLTAAMGRGQGQFVFSATDACNNTGSSVSPNQIEIYNTEHPNAPGVPTGLKATTLAGGKVKIEWNAVSDAQSYRIYREAGNSGVPPVVRVAEGIAATEWTDQTIPDDGIYRYVVRAFRVSIEGNPSGTLNALSDKTPPGKPEEVDVELTTSGLRITWQPPSQGALPYRYYVYRNGIKIHTVTTPQPVLDFPPKGLHEYRVSAVDNYDNEASADPVPFEFFVDAVGSLLAQVRQGQPTILSWAFSDPVGTGYNVYRNGVKQNAQPIAVGIKTFTDLLPLPPEEAVEYRVTAVDNQSREGAPRTVRVQPVTWSLLLNPNADGTPQISRTQYFENYKLTVINNDKLNELKLGKVEVSRTLSGGVASLVTHQTSLEIPHSDRGDVLIPVPGPELPGQSQSVELSVHTAPSVSGSVVAYTGTGNIIAGVEPPLMVEMRVVAPPVAGGLAHVKTRIHNRGYSEMVVILGRQTGQQPGDLAIKVLNEAGVEIGRRAFSGLGATGVIVRPNGDVCLTIAPGSSSEVTVEDILIPSVLAENGKVTFQAEISKVYSSLGTPNERIAGPLTGTLQSTVIETPYFGSVTTVKDIFSGDEPIVISGQATDRASSNPQGNVPMRIGFSARGAVWYEDVEVGADGTFVFNYVPFAGFAGELTIWAAHPDVYDVLVQKTVRIYRIYATPSFGNIRMSKNDHLDFTINLINPSELALDGLNVAFRAYKLDTDGETQINVPQITGGFREGQLTALAANSRTAANLRMQATADAPDNVLIEITFTTAQGASTKFQGTAELLPAVPILSMTSPRQGYVDVTVNRGQIVSREITIRNLGTRDLLDVELVPPKIVPWMQINLPVNSAGNAQLPNLAVGGSFTFTVAFVPPENTPQGYVDDKVKIRGSNVIAGFDFNLYALVSSDARGEATFHVENFLGQDVPNASVRIRNSITGEEVGPLNTDAEGNILFPNLTEGLWSWQVTASGHSSATGTLDVVPAQTTIVEPVLQRSLVTVTFQVKPVPFTDRYEIVIEQTFETFVPAPVLVMTPPKYDFKNVRPGFETTVIYELKNHGLIKVFNVDVTGSFGGLLTMEPLIDFIPELLPQQTVQIPTRVRLANYATSQEAGGCDESLDDWIERRMQGPPQIHPDGYVFGGPAPTIGNAIGGFCPTPNLADFINGISAIASIGADGCFQSQQSGSLGTAAAVALGAAVAYETVTSIPGSIADVVMQVVSALGQCAAAHFAPAFGGNGGNSGGGSGNNRNNGGYGMGGNGCFTADTPVKLADGQMRAISQLRAGDVLSTGTDVRETGAITHLYQLDSDELYEMSLREVDQLGSTARTLRVTGEHMIWLDGSGWTAARKLKPGDWLHGENGEMIEIASVKSIPGTHRVYTLQLKGNASFFAGGVLVQDLCGGLYLDNTVLSKLQLVKP